MYVIWNLTQRAYVARPGRARSYTNRIELIRPFTTREAAKANACGDERVVALSEVLGG